jgi:hypothetical protein
MIWIAPWASTGCLDLSEIGIFVRSTAGLMFREKYSFLARHPVRLPV